MYRNHYLRIVPESIRWLVSNKRYEEAKRLILKAAKENKRRIPDHLLIPPHESTNIGVV